MSYTKELKKYAELSQISYQKKRPEKFELLNMTFDYKPEKSTDLYCHYENEYVILVAAHGVNDRSMTVIAATKFLIPQSKDTYTTEFCNKFNELEKEKKKVVLIGHSFGCLAIGYCMKHSTKTYHSVFFAPFTPNINSSLTKYIASNPKIKKIVYDTDPAAKAILKINGLTNTLVFHNSNLLFQASTIQGHSIKNFMTDINRDFVKKY